MDCSYYCSTVIAFLKEESSIVMQEILWAKGTMVIACGNSESQQLSQKTNIHVFLTSQMKGHLFRYYLNGND